MTAPAMAFIGRAPCGCVRAVELDDGNPRTAVSRWAGDGLAVEYVTAEEAGRQTRRCPHGETR